MNTYLLVILLIFQLAIVIICDQGYYLDTVGASLGDSYITQTPIPVVQVEIYTSHEYLAGTTDAIYATFIGEFSNSGPHSLGTFLQGNVVTVNVSLDRIIGTLKEIRLEKKGYDGWLLQNMECTIGNIRYQMKGPKQWLDVLNSYEEDVFGDGYEHFSSTLIPSSSTLSLLVASSYKIYTSTGLSS